jgi:ribosomal protein L37E
MTWEAAGQNAKQTLRCLICGNTTFDREEGRLDSRWGFTSHKLVMMICQRCGFVHQFFAGRGIWDFD